MEMQDLLEPVVVSVTDEAPEGTRKAGVVSRFGRFGARVIAESPRWVKFRARDDNECFDMAGAIKGYCGRRDYDVDVINTRHKMERSFRAIKRDEMDTTPPVGDSVDEPDTSSEDRVRRWNEPQED